MTREEELMQTLTLRSEAMARVIEERDALKIALGKRLGGGIDITRYEHQLVCKACGQIVAIPDHHACSP